MFALYMFIRWGVCRDGEVWGTLSDVLEQSLSRIAALHYTVPHYSVRHEL